MTQLPTWTQKLHHDGSEVFVSPALPKYDDLVSIKFTAPLDAPIRFALMRSMMDGEFFYWKMTQKTTDTQQIWSANMPIQQRRTDYRFRIVSDDGAFFLTASGVHLADSPDYDSFVIASDYDAPLWVREQVFYQIFPDRFHNGDPSNDVQNNEYEHRGKPTIKRNWGELPKPWKESGAMDFFGGDLQGVTQKLDYLRDLGVTGVYLCPIFKADTNHKYDILDFFNVDEHFGGNEALAQLREESEKRGMKLMLDITTNHISETHDWFKQVEKDHDAENAEFFFYDAAAREFERWLGVPLLVKLNYGSQRLRDIMYRSDEAAMKQWINPPYSIDGWRLDVANMTGNFRQEQNDHDVWREMRESLKAEQSDLYLLGEYFQDGTAHLQGDELDASMNYQGFNLPVRRWLSTDDLDTYTSENPYLDTVQIPTEVMVRQWQLFMNAIPYPIALQQFNQLDSHDTTRILHETKGDKALVRAGLGLLFSFPGVPCVYYGTEVGMDGGHDPDNRRTMVWDADGQDTDMLDYTKRLARIREASHALKHGGFQVLYGTGDIVAFQRHSSEETMIVVVNRGADGSTVDIETSLANGATLTDMLTETVYAISNGVLSLRDVAHGQVLMLRLNPIP